MSSKHKKQPKGTKIMENTENEKPTTENTETKEEPKFTSGVVVDTGTNSVGVEASPQIRATVQATRTDKHLTKKDTRNNFEIHTDSILESGTDGEKNIITNMRLYLDKMKDGARMTVDELVRTQQMFYTTIRFAFKQTDSFKPCMRLLVQYFHYYGNEDKKLLGERYVFRGIQHFTLSKPHQYAFQHVVGLLQRISRMENPSKLLSQIDIDRELNNTFSDAERQRFVSFLEMP